MEHYIFCSNLEIEKQRLEILNNNCNENTKKILGNYINPKMKVLECGFGHGQISDFINAIDEIDYMGIDNNVGRVAQRYHDKKFVFGDLTNLDDVKSLKRKKFDVIYARWILAYLPQYKVSSVLEQLYDMLKNGGKLILEECDLYKSYLSKNNEKIQMSVFNDWIDLSRFVQVMINSCNFRMGSELPDILSATFKKQFDKYTYQPVLKGNDKRIITLGLRSAENILLEKNILNKDELRRMIYNVEYGIIDKNDIDLHYIESTTCVLTK